MNDTIDFAFLDSGTGGIPYMLALKEKTPDSRFVYLGDTAHFPYGQKSASEVTECASEVIDKMIALWNPRALVIACNTISVTALDRLRKNFPFLPIIGTVPAIRLAARMTKNKKIGLLATNATVNHPYCQRLTEDFASDCIVFKRGDPDLIAFIEHNLFTADSQTRLDAVRPAVEYFCSCGCDTIILGCTHFTHMSDDVRKVFSELSPENEVFVVDSRDGVSNHAVEVIRNSGNCPVRSGNMLPPDMSFFVTKADRGTVLKEYELLCSRFSIPFGGVI